MTAIVWDSKGPLEVKIYDLDWSADLAPGDVITSSSWQIVTTDNSGNLTVLGNGNTSTITQVKTSGGADKFNYVVRNSVTTAGGETLYADVMLPIRTK